MREFVMSTTCKIQNGAMSIQDISSKKAQTANALTKGPFAALTKPMPMIEMTIPDRKSVV